MIYAPDMKLCVAQTRPVTGDIHANIIKHNGFIDVAAANGADLIVFPELSLTGYEPTLANELAADSEDPRFDLFQAISDARNITVGLGVPTRHNSGVCISMILFQPHKPRLTYSKRYLHPDEEPFFVSGQNLPSVSVDDTIIAPAICYELSVADHAETACRRGAGIYVASVAKTAKGLDAAIPRLAEIARKYSMTVLMSNCVGQCDGVECAGKTAVWSKQGVLLGQLNENDEGILIHDTNTQDVVEKAL